jgi:hypothetical protein
MENISRVNCFGLLSRLEAPPPSRVAPSSSSPACERSQKRRQAKPKTTTCALRGLFYVSIQWYTKVCGIFDLATSTKSPTPVSARLIHAEVPNCFVAIQTASKVSHLVPLIISLAWKVMAITRNAPKPSKRSKKSL